MGEEVHKMWKNTGMIGSEKAKILKQQYLFGQHRFLLLFATQSLFRSKVLGIKQTTFESRHAVCLQEL